MGEPGDSTEAAKKTKNNLHAISRIEICSINTGGAPGVWRAMDAFLHEVKEEQLGEEDVEGAGIITLLRWVIITTEARCQTNHANSFQEDPQL